jgi:hypothetical protein
MKKKRTITTLIFGMLLGVFSFCHAQTTTENPGEEGASFVQTEVYYFHFTHRCATCMAVERESKKALHELYPEEMKSGDMTFVSLNLDEKTNGPLAEELKVSGQTLLIIKGDKRKDLTNTAFMYARTNPEKLKKAISEAIEKM